MEHRKLLGGLQHLPFARSRIRALRATGLPYASERLLLPDGIVTVRVIPGHEFIRLEGRGMAMYAIGVESNHVVVYTKTTDGYGDWREHSRFTDAWLDPDELIPAVKLDDRRFIAKLLRTADTPGATGSDPMAYYAEHFGKGHPLSAGAPWGFLGGSFWVQTAWVMSTDGAGGAYLLRAEDLTGAGAADDRNIIWRCEQNAFGSTSVTSKPAIYTFSGYSAGAHGGRPLKTVITDNIVYLGDGRFAYGIGGSSYNAYSPRDADSKMALVVTQDFETHTGYDVATGLGSVFGADDYALSSGCWLGNDRCLFTGYGDTNTILFDTTTGAMSKNNTSDAGWSTTLAAIMPMGEDAACYWRYDPGPDAFNLDAQFVYTLDAGSSWNSSALFFEDQNGDPLTVDFCLGTTSVRKPYTSSSTGELLAIFHVPGRGHCEFRSKDLGTTWRENGLISAEPATSTVGLLFRHILVGAPGLALNWG